MFFSKVFFLTVTETNAFLLIIVSIFFDQVTGFIYWPFKYVMLWLKSVHVLAKLCNAILDSKHFTITMCSK